MDRGVWRATAHRFTKSQTRLRDWARTSCTAQGPCRTRIPEGVAIPSPRGSSRPRNRTGVSCIAGGFFTSWATREALSLAYSLLNIYYWLLQVCILVQQSAYEYIHKYIFKILTGVNESNHILSFGSYCLGHFYFPASYHRTSTKCKIEWWMIERMSDVAWI